MRFINNKIVIERELSELDRFTIDFVDIIKKHTDYVIVSGYVAILLGRARASEDVDIIIPERSIEEFRKLNKAIIERGFYCLNTDTIEDIYGYLEDNLAVRYAKKGTAIPNIELKFARKQISKIALKDSIIVDINNINMNISCLELQIAFKEKVLMSEKDLEDAKHIRAVAKGHLDTDKIKIYERMLDGF